MFLEIKERVKSRNTGAGRLKARCPVTRKKKKWSDMAETSPSTIGTNFRKPVLLLSGLFCCLLICSQVAFAEIYKYVDHRGRTIYTDTPRSANYVKVNLNPKGWVDPTPGLAFYSLKGRADKYSPYVEQAARQYRLPKALLQAVITVESAYNPSAVSPAGAQGLMQLMPATAQRFGVRNSFSPHENILGGSRYLRYLMNLFDNNLSLALAAYNAGEGAVMKYGNTIPPYIETQKYVRKVMHYHRLYSS